MNYKKSVKVHDVLRASVILLCLGAGSQINASAAVTETVAGNGDNVSTSVMITQQSKSISGVVTDEKGEPIIGANVTVEGTTIGTITDIDGNFNWTFRMIRN